jgi:hypothetical protein
MRLNCGRRCRWGLILGALLIALAGVAWWLVHVQPATPARIRQAFPATGVKKVLLRTAAAAKADVTTDPTANVVEVSGLPTGGASGYHSPDFWWRETPAAEWGLGFTSARHGDVLVISTENEIHYIHHLYFLKSVSLRVPVGVEVVREPRQWTGDGAPNLEPSKP